MALKLVTIGDNWNIIYSERPNGEKVLWDVSGNGAEFVVPADVAEIRKRAFDIYESFFYFALAIEVGSC